MEVVRDNCVESVLHYQHRMEAIRDNHIVKGLTYPRPSMLCPNCNKDGILCWGEAMRLHLRHAVENGCSDYNPSGESLEHAKAKELLKTYLVNGGKVLARSKCYLCKTMKSPNYFMKNESEIVLEYKYNGIVFDLACVIGNTVIFGAEICETHKTSTVSERSDVSWFEINASQIIAFLDSKDPPKHLYLSDLRDDVWTKCDNCQTAKTYTMDELAKELGYKQVYSPYPTESRKLLDHCWGYYNVMESWSVRGKADRMLWSHFLAEKKCMKCLKRHDTAKFKTFCDKCFGDIKEEPNYEIKVLVADQERDRCRKLFSWLYNIPGGWTIGEKCHGCKRNYTSADDNNLFPKFWEPRNDYVKCYTKWGKEKRKCCTVCLQERYENSIK